MMPGKYDIVIYAGATYIETVAWWRDFDGGVQIDLRDYDGLMEVRAQDGTLLVTLSTGNGRFIPQSDKRAQLFIDDTATRTLTPGNAYRYDLLVEERASGIVTALLGGRVRVTELVTRDAP